MEILVEGKSMKSAPTDFRSQMASETDLQQRQQFARFNWHCIAGNKAIDGE
jgi:hypothetical protein